MASNPAVASSKAYEASRGNCLIVAGVSGSGKTTVSRALAERLDWSMIEADSLHTPANIHKMHSGTALDDADRWPWLERVANSILKVRNRTDGVVVACSALRRTYRDFLVARVSGLIFCQLDVTATVAEQRMTHRTGHFMSPSLLPSQLSTLEPLSDDEQGFVVDANRSLDRVLEDVIEDLASGEGLPNLHGASHNAEAKAVDRP